MEKGEIKGIGVDIDQTLMPLLYPQVLGYASLIRGDYARLIKESLGINSVGAFDSSRVLIKALEFGRKERNSLYLRPQRMFEKREDGTYVLLGFEEVGIPGEVFKEMREQVRTSTRLLTGPRPLPGAVEGVKQLCSVLSSSDAYFAYLTARPQVKSVEEDTKAWLERYKFPNPEKAIVVRDTRKKLEILRKKVPEGRILIVDDNLKSVVESLSKKPEFEDLKSRLIVLAFGLHPRALSIKELQEWVGEKVEEGEIFPQEGVVKINFPSGLAVVCFQRWAQVEQVIERLRV